MASDCRRQKLCVTDTTQGMRVVSHPVALVVPFASTCLCTTFIQPSCFACSALANSLAADSRRMCFAATRNVWSRLGLWRSFSKWRVGICDGSGLWVCQWCVVTQSCVLQMVVLLRLGHVSSHTHEHCGENPLSVIAHTHVSCKRKESVVTDHGGQ